MASTLEELNRRAKTNDDLAAAYLTALSLMKNGMKEFSLFSDDEINDFMFKEGVETAKKFRNG